MEWAAVSATAGSISAIAGATGAVVAATALRRNREDQARRDAAGLHASIYFAPWRFLPGQELEQDEEPSDRTAEWLVVKVDNASAHPYYAVMASVYLPRRRRRFAATADIVPPHSTRYARLVLVEGCDTMGLSSDTLVDTTFVDSQGRGWRRDTQGTLERRKIVRRWVDAELHGQPHRAAALHQVRECVEPDGEGLELHVARDAEGHEVEIKLLDRSASEAEGDSVGYPSPMWQPRESRHAEGY